MARPTVPPERLDIVEELWRKCVSNGAIAQRLAQEWNVDRRTIRSYITKVVRRNAGLRRKEEVDDSAQRAEFARTLAMFEDIYLRGLEGQGAKGAGKDLKTALNAAHRRAQLLGLYPASRFEVTGANGKPLEVSPDAAVAKLLGKIAEVETRAQPGAPPAGRAEDE